MSMELLWDGSERIKGKGKGHPCTGTEALYRLYGLQGGVEL